MNKKKQITLVLFICIIAVVSFASYAIIQQNKKNTPDNNDLTKLAILVDGVKQKEFPTKDSGKIFEKAECTNEANGTWDKENWKLSIQNIIGPTECTISFKTKTTQSVFASDTSNASVPVINNGLIPVYYDGQDWVKADTTKAWYNYDKQLWANAVTVTSSSKSKYTSAVANTSIDMNDIETMWVWIPRYEYQHTNLSTQYAGGTSATAPGAITINFITKDTTTSSSSNFTIHDAFKWGDEEASKEQLAGIWVAKFEMSTGATTCTAGSTAGSGCDLTTIKPYIKPNVTSWRGARIGTLWTAINRNMNGSSNQYGLTNTDAHLMKNMEWGAVAYLSQSKYGKYGNPNYTGADKEVAINNCNAYITGIGGDTVSASSSSTTCTTNTYETTKGQAASTTGNIYGIYDMSRGAREYVMAVMKESSNTEPAVGWSSSKNSGWSGKLYNGTAYTGTFGKLKDIGSKYYDLYDYNLTSGLPESIAHKGDATFETKGWYSDRIEFVINMDPFLARGWSNSGSSSGVFALWKENGSADSGASGRPVLVPLN